MSVTKVPANVLSSTHFHVLQATVARILDTDIARQTYAQIIDGAPSFAASHTSVGGHNCHAETCEEAFRLWDTLRVQFSLDQLSFKSSAIQGFQNAALGSQEFILRLLELAVVACHDIAVHLFNTSEGGLRPIPLTTSPYFENHPMIFIPQHLPPTAFSYGGYQNVDAYPHGVADCAGYWVEFEIFGGVVLFDRGESGSECKSAFIDPAGDYMIAELSETQRRDFMAFALGERGREPPFPWKGERGGPRIDPAESFKRGIYRDRFERKSPRRLRPCVRRMEDLPLDILNSMAALDEAEAERQKGNGLSGNRL